MAGSSAGFYRKTMQFLKREILFLSTLFAVIIGIVLSVALRHVEISTEVLLLVELPGHAFLSLLKMLVLPIMISSVITGSATLTSKTEGRIAVISLLYFLATTFISSLIGLILVFIIHPGTPEVRQIFDGPFGTESYHTRLLDTLLDLFRNAFPNNLLEACMFMEYTEYIDVTDNVTDLSHVKKVVSKRMGVNALGLIIFCIVFGVCMGAIGEQANVIKDFFVCLDKLVMKLVLKILWLMPIGVISLICAKFLGVGDIVFIVQQMSLFMTTVLLGLAIELFLLQPLLYWIFTKKNPFTFLANCFDAAITAFGVSSSSAAMPVTLRCLEEKCDIDPRISRFVIPIGVTVNMDGTALFITAATVFIAQMNFVQIGAGGIIAILVTATTVSIATTSVPSASIFLMVMCLTVIGAPVNDISLLFATEWILDRSRTVNNVLGDAFACGVVNHLCKEKLDEAQAVIEDIQQQSRKPSAF